MRSSKRPVGALPALRGAAGLIVLIAFAMLPMAMVEPAAALAVHGDPPEASVVSAVEAPDPFSGVSAAPARPVHATLAPAEREDALHRSLLQAPQALPIPPHAPAPLAPISPDPGADIIPLPGSFIGGICVLGLLVIIRYWRR